MKKFGRTWWGNLWLNTFQGIDYSNRLPRGRSYATPRRVPHIEIDGHTAKAPVQGRQDEPYQVKLGLRPFTKKQKQQIIATVARNPHALGELVNGVLPQQVYDIAEHFEIELLPKDWNSVYGSCSCPDWAVPCKHLAAVVYLLSLEIDKNPFLIFQMHGMDLVKEIKKVTNIEVREIPLSANVLVEPGADSGDDQPDDSALSLLQMDLSVIPDLEETIFGLLSEEPLFYEKDFREVLATHYKRIARWVIRFDKQERTDLIQIRDYSDGTLVLKHDGKFAGIFDSREKCIHRYEDDWIEELTSVRSHGVQAVNEGDKRAVFWYVLYRFALKLLVQKAYVPHVVATAPDRSAITWRAASLDSSVTNILERFYECCPSDLVRVDSSSAELPSRRLDQKSQVDSALNTLLSHFITRSFSELQMSRQGDEILGWFFGGVIQTFEWFGVVDIPKVVQRWLNCLTLRYRNYQMLLVVEETWIDDEESEIDDEDEDISELVQTGIHISVELKIQLDTRILTIPQLVLESETIEDSSKIFSDLAFLSSYFPDLQKVLTNPSPESGVTINYEITEFAPILMNSLPMLQLLGVKLVLPKGLNKLLRPQLSMRVSSSSSASIKSYLDLATVASFDWEVALGDTRISTAEFNELINSVSGLVRIKDQYVLLDDDEMAAIARRMEDLPNSLSSLEILRGTFTQEIDDAAVEIDESLKQLLDSAMQTDSISIPTNLTATLREYQKRGYEWLAVNDRMGLGSLLADDMGLGKTVQVIALLARQKELGELDKSSALVVAPTSLLTNWRKEIERFAPQLTVDVYHGSDRDISSLDSDVVLSSYGIVRSDIAKLRKRKFRTLVIDEAQNIKNPATKQTRAVKQISAASRVALSGTPVENRLLDYWSIFDFAMRGYLGSRRKFSTEVAKPIELDQDQERLDKFKKMTQPFIMRRLKTDKTIIKDLPDKIESDRFCTLSPKQASIYQSAVDQIMPSLKNAESNIQRSGIVLKLITALKQICNAPSHYLKKNYTSANESGKLALFVDILGEALDAEEKVIVFTQFTQMGKLLVQCVETEFGMKVPMLHGGLSRKRRDEMIESFQSDSRVRAMVLSLKAGGTGINLTAANQVVHYDLWWNPAVETQATDRAYRIGQNKRVLVHRLLTENTFEERINEMIQDKRALADLVVTDGEFSISTLSNDEIRELVQLN